MTNVKLDHGHRRIRTRYQANSYRYIRTSWARGRLLYSKTMGPHTLVSLSQFCNSSNKFIGAFIPTEYRMYNRASAVSALKSLSAHGIEVGRGTVKNVIYVRSWHAHGARMLVTYYTTSSRCIYLSDILASNWHRHYLFSASYTSKDAAATSRPIAALSCIFYVLYG